MLTIHYFITYHIVLDSHNLLACSRLTLSQNSPHSTIKYYIYIYLCMNIENSLSQAK